MEVTVRWLVDTSALRRTTTASVSDALVWRVGRGLVGISIATELEVGYSARSGDGYRVMRRALVDQLIPVALSVRAEDRARQVQAALVERGQHRSAGVADLLIAATAEVEGLSVLHYDADFDHIAEVTGQLCEWIVPRGTV